MKKLISLVLALALVLASCAVAFAAAPTTGSITVAKNNKGQTYTLYKLFDAEISFTGNDTDGYTQSAITYKLPTGKSLDTTGAQWFEINDNGFVEAKSALTQTVMKSREFIDWAKGFGTANPTTKTATVDDDTSIKWEGLEFGYYLVDSTLGSFISIDSANPNASVNDKNNPPSIDKKITGVKDASGTAEGSVFDRDDGSDDEVAIAQVGDTVSYSVTVTVKPGAEAYVISDTMTHLTLVASSVKVDGDLYSASTKVNNAQGTTTSVVNGATSFTIELAQSWLDDVTSDTAVVVTYDAILGADAVVKDDANPNTVTLTWGHDPANNHTEDDSEVWSAKIGVDKRINSETGDPLSGAGFVLKNASNKYYKRDAATDVVTWVENIADATERFTDATGLIAPFEGLPNGTYTLVEKTVPNGYNKTADTEITIAASDVTAANLAQTATVVNNAGTTLPSTGGIGTTIFYAVGGLMVLGAAIILVSRRKAEAR